MFKVGDVCVLISAHVHPEMIGAECTIYEVGDFGAGEYRCKFHEFPTEPNTHWVAWREQLRLKRLPKDDAEPRSDFTPGDWDLMPWRPTKERA